MTITGWRKSRRSAYNGNCIEAGNWRSACAGNGSCLEAASCTHGVAVRDTTLTPSSPVLFFGADDWRRFTSALKREAVMGDA